MARLSFIISLFFYIKILFHFQGHTLNVFDISPTACSALQTNGVTIAKSPEEVASKSDFVISMLPNSQIVYDTYEKITKAGVNKKTIFIDSSTIDPTVVKKVNNPIINLIQAKLIMVVVNFFLFFINNKTCLL